MNNLSDGKKDLWEEITYLTNKRAQNEKKKKIYKKEIQK